MTLYLFPTRRSYWLIIFNVCCHFIQSFWRFVLLDFLERRAARGSFFLLWLIGILIFIRFHQWILRLLLDIWVVTLVRFALSCGSYGWVLPRTEWFRLRLAVLQRIKGTIQLILWMTLLLLLFFRFLSFLFVLMNTTEIKPTLNSVFSYNTWLQGSLFIIHNFNYWLFRLYGWIVIFILEVRSWCITLSVDQAIILRRGLFESFLVMLSLFIFRW